MKECPKCKEKYPDGADTCPECYVDLDTGEAIGIDKDIDLEELKEAFSDSIFSFKVDLWSIAMLFISVIIMISSDNRIIYLISREAAFISAVTCFVMYFKLSSSLNNLCEIIGENSPLKEHFIWFSPLFIGYGVYLKAKEILKTGHEAR
ncbi:MAG: hypothetical protein Q8N67_05605 [Candidatus Omnitrophota bacterium]|nr:hypothetical protein [Candidatus Omnitrophota bacterium]